MMHRNKEYLHRVLVLVSGALFLFSSANVSAQTATLVNSTDLSLLSPPSPDPAGLTYMDLSDTLLVSDSEVNETPLFTGDNLFEVNRDGTLVKTLTTMGFTNEPTGLSYNPLNKHLFVSMDNKPKKIYEVDPGIDGLYNTGDDQISSFTTTLYGSYDAEGIAFNVTQGTLHIVDGLNSEVYTIHPGNNGVFDGVPPEGDDTYTSFDTLAFGISDPEGIGYDSDFGHLYIVGKPKKTVAHVTVDGVLLRVLNISAADPVKPAGLVYAPSSQTPGVNNLYIVDRGVDNNADPDENDGRLYELSLPEFFGNSPPSVVITGPASGSAYVLGDIVSLEGNASDTEDGNLSSQLIWSSNIDGGLGQGSTVLVSTLSIGEHVIEATVSDTEQATAATTILLSVTETANAPPTVAINSPNTGAIYQTSDVIEFAGVATDNEDGDLSAAIVWHSDLDGPLGTGTFLGTLSEGDHVISVSVADSGGLTGTATTDVMVNPTTDDEIALELQVSASHDDAEEKVNLNVSLSSLDLQLVYNNPGEQVVGVRFNGVFIPQGSGILEASIQFESAEANSGLTNLTLQGQAIDNASIFRNQAGDVSARPVTMAATEWTPPPWTAVGLAGSDQNTTDLRLPIQEVVGRSGWVAGNSLVVLIRGTGKRVAQSFEGNSAAAARLHIVYSTVNTPPSVEAGSNQSVPVNDSINLAGSVSDDGVPDNPGSVSTLWRLVEGPGEAAFNDATSLTGGVSFNTTGSHVLELIADDGELEGLDQTTITVGPSSGNTSPVVDAGPDSIGVVNTPIDLAGSITDDGLPNPPGMTIAQWSRLSGPDSVFFADAQAENTTVTFAVPGSYTLQLSGDDSELQMSDQLSLIITDAAGVLNLDIPVVDSSDDAEERSAGDVSISSGDLEMVFDNGGDQIVGLRFRGVQVPADATIVNAYVQFQVDEPGAGFTDLAIRGEYTVNAPAFVGIADNLTSRETTSAVAGWVPGAWNAVGDAGLEQQTPDLSPILQEIITHPNWVAGNPVVLLVSGSGLRVADSYDGSATGAPRLHLEFQLNN